MTVRKCADLKIVILFLAMNAFFVVLVQAPNDSVVVHINIDNEEDDEPECLYRTDSLRSCLDEEDDEDNYVIMLLSDEDEELKKAFLNGEYCEEQAMKAKREQLFSLAKRFLHDAVLFYQKAQTPISEKRCKVLLNKMGFFAAEYESKSANLALEAKANAALENQAAIGVLFSVQIDNRSIPSHSFKTKIHALARTALINSEAMHKKSGEFPYHSPLEILYRAAGDFYARAAENYQITEEYLNGF